MSDNQPVFNIQRVYLKGVSLEMPHAPHIFLEQKQPAVEVQLDVSPQALADNIYETTVTVTVTTKVEDKVAFLVEASEAGIFEIRGLPDEQMELVLNVVCANVVYPYLRGNVADIIQRGGFPPVHLAEINFEALYQQRLQAQQQAGQSLAGQAQPGAAGEGSGIILPS